MRNASRTGFLIILVLSIHSCAGNQTVEVPNFHFYGDKGKFGATEVESLHPEKPGVRLAKSKWDEMRIGMACTPVANVTTIQNIIDKLCSENPVACHYAGEGVSQVQNTLSQMKRATVE